MRGLIVIDEVTPIPQPPRFKTYGRALEWGYPTGVGYRYLTLSQTWMLLRDIVEKFSDMQEDLERERKTMTKLWSKREQQIRTVIESTAGMYGDLQGIAGKTLQEIEGLEMKLLTDETPES